MMKQVVITTLSLALAGLLAAVPLYAQGGRGAKAQQQYHRMYDLNTVETLDGTVSEVIYRPGKMAGMQGVEILLKTPAGTVPVHLGPVWYVEQQEQFEEGDRVIVTGSRITFEDQSVLIAAKVQRGEMTLQLRDRQGLPVWRGWRTNGRSN